MAGKLSPERIAIGFAVLAGLIVLWNAAAYPAGAGYDAPSHQEYADFLIHHLRLPFRNETPEYYSPPLYYAIAGAVTWVGREIGLGEPHKLGQLLNVPAVIGTVLLVSALARLIWPKRRWLAPAAAGFVALSPVLTRTGVDVQPGADRPVRLDALPLPRRADARPAELRLEARARARHRARRRRDGAAVLAVDARRRRARVPRRDLEAAGGAARGCARTRRRARRRRRDRRALVRLPCGELRQPGLRPAALVEAALGAPARRASTSRPACRRSSRSPYRPKLVNLAWPETYADIWGDWYGVFAWSREAHPKPSPARNGWLVVQQIVGLIPTALAIGGWLVLLWLAARRRDPPRLLVSLLPLAGLAGYLYFTVSYPTPDGDVLKPTYMLTTLGAWALCFGYAAVKLGERWPRLVAWTLVTLAVIDLPFVIYKGAVGL